MIDPPLSPAELSQQNSLYRRMLEVCDTVADAALQGADPAELTRVFANLLDRTVILLTARFELRTAAGGVLPDWDPGQPGVARLLRALATERRPLRIPAIPGSVFGCLATPVAVGDTTLGYLLVLAGPAAPDDLDLLVLSYTATLFALTLAHEQTSTELGLRHRSGLVDALVSGSFLDEQDAQEKAIGCGLTAGQPYRVAMLKASARRLADQTATHILGRIAESLPGAAASHRGPDLVVLLPQSENREVGPATLAAILTEVPRHLGLSGGLSDQLEGAQHAPRGLTQAERAIDVGMRTGRAGQLIRHDELGIYRLLMQVSEIRQVWQFAEEILGPVLEYETSHKLDLIGTLSTYLATHGSLKQTARLLDVHTNTVAYRIQRIEKLTHLDLAAPDDRLLTHVAVKIVETQRT
jgi:sugar diacid utilization regulator